MAAMNFHYAVKVRKKKEKKKHIEVDKTKQINWLLHEGKHKFKCKHKTFSIKESRGERVVRSINWKQNFEIHSTYSLTNSNFRLLETQELF